MKKKVLTTAAAVLLLLLCIPMVVFAASPVAGNTSIGPSINADPNTELKAQSVYDAQSVSNIIQIVSHYYSNLEPYTVIDIYDLELKMTGTQNNAPIPDDFLVRVDMAGVTVTDKVIVMHLTASGDVEPLPATTYDGYITFHPTSFSVFALLYFPNGNPDGAARDTSSGGGATTPSSPKTGVYGL